MDEPKLNYLCFNCSNQTIRVFCSVECMLRYYRDKGYVILVFVMLDFITTFIAINYFSLEEQNYIPRTIIENEGFYGLFMFQIFVYFSIVGVLYHLRLTYNIFKTKFLKKFVEYFQIFLLGYIIVAYFIVVFGNIFLIIESLV